MRKIDAATFSRLMAEHKEAATYAMILAYIKVALKDVKVDDAVSTYDLTQMILDEEALGDARKIEMQAFHNIIKNLGKKDLALWWYQGPSMKLYNKMVRPKRWFDGSKYDKPKPTHCVTCGQLLPDTDPI